MLFLSKSYWRYVFSIKRTFYGLLQAFGFLWLIVQISRFFSPVAEAWVKGHPGFFFVVGIAWTIVINWPRHVVCHRLTGRDVTLEIRVGDVFKQKGSLIIGTNTTFDTATPDIISVKSVQGQFSSKNYQNITHLDADIENQTKSIPSEDVSASKPGKTKRYPVGTVAKIVLKDKRFYLVAIATLNGNCTAQGTFEDIQNSLAKLWEFITTDNDLQPLVMPVIGTGFSRITETREEVIKEIIKSFVAGCANRVFCPKLTIVIPVKDFYEHNINLAELQNYLSCTCLYTQTAPKTIGSGTAIE